jgi:DNA-binding beta-propeller fold protein YncE
MPLQRSTVSLVLAAAALAACAVEEPVRRSGKPAPSAGGGAKGPVATAARFEGTLAGVARSPASLLATQGGGIISSNTAGLISNNAGGLISNNAGGLISNNAGGLISNNAGGYRLFGTGAVYYSLQAEELLPVAKRRAVLLDGARRRVRGVAPVETDTQGRFRFENVPPGNNWAVEVQLDGFILTGLGNAEQSDSLEVTPTTTIVTEHLRVQLKDRLTALQVLPIGTYRKLTADVEQVVRGGGIRIDLSNQTKASQTFEQIVAKAPTLVASTAAVLQTARAELSKAIGAGGQLAGNLTESEEERRPEARLAVDMPSLVAKFASYVAGRSLGAARDLGRGSAVEVWNGLPVQWFYGGADTQGHCVVVFGPQGPKLIRNDFYDLWLSAAQYWTLGAPLDEEVEVDEALKIGDTFYPGPLRRQTFENGVLSWTAKSGVAVQLRGGALAVTERTGRVQYPPPGTNAVLVTTWLGAEAGSTDGDAATARFALPWGMAVDPIGTMFIGDNQNGHIRRIDATGNVTTFLGPSGEPPLLPSLSALAAAGPDVLYAVTSSRIVRVRRGKAPELIAGGEADGTDDGPGKDARFNLPRGLALSKDGATLFVADSGNDRIRKIDLRDKTYPVTTLAGGTGSGLKDGPAADALFRHPHGIVVDAGGWLYVADSDNNALRRISPTGQVVTIAGGTQVADTQDGPASGPAEQQARFNRPMGLVMNPDGDLIVTEEAGHSVRKVALGTGRAFTIAGSNRPAPQPGTVQETAFADGPGNVAMFSGPAGVTIDKDGQIFVADRDNNRIRKVVPSIKFEAVTPVETPKPAAKQDPDDE